MTELVAVLTRIQVSCCSKVLDRTKVSTTKAEPYTQLFILHRASCLLLALYNLPHISFPI